MREMTGRGSVRCVRESERPRLRERAVQVFRQVAELIRGQELDGLLWTQQFAQASDSSIIFSISWNNTWAKFNLRREEKPPWDVAPTPCVEFSTPGSQLQREEKCPVRHCYLHSHQCKCYILAVTSWTNKQFGEQLRFKHLCKSKHIQQSVNCGQLALKKCGVKQKKINDLES